MGGRAWTGAGVGGRARGGARREPGFSLLECLIVVAVLAVLVALALPALRSSRERAELLADEAHARQMFDIVVLYAAEYKDVFPTRGNDLVARTGLWVTAASAAGFGGLHLSISRSGMPYKMTFAAYVPDAALEPGKVRPMEEVAPVTRRLSEVRHPARKGLMWPVVRRRDLDIVPPPVWCCTDHPPVGAIPFLDGSVLSTTWSALIPPEGLRIEFWAGFPVHSTWQGLAGVDRR